MEGKMDKPPILTSSNLGLLLLGSMVEVDPVT